MKKIIYSVLALLLILGVGYKFFWIPAYKYVEVDCLAIEGFEELCPGIDKSEVESLKPNMFLADSVGYMEEDVESKYSENPYNIYYGFYYVSLFSKKQILDGFEAYFKSSSGGDEFLTYLASLYGDDYTQGDEIRSFEVEDTEVYENVSMPYYYWDLDGYLVFVQFFNDPDDKYENLRNGWNFVLCYDFYDVEDIVSGEVSFVY